MTCLVLSITFNLTAICFTQWQELADHADEVNVQHEILEGIFTFYDSTSGRLNIYQVFTIVTYKW